MHATAICKKVTEDIERKLNEIGIMYRIFSRVKSEKSLTKKIQNDQAYGKTKKIQDLIGVRVITYFPDDISIVHEIASAIFKELQKDNSIDEHNNTIFKPIRYNIIYKSPEEIYVSTENRLKIDDTFELQIRTVLSEGWHEVEHDLRYKRKEDWIDLDDHSRKLNGVYATLETSEWTILKIFEDLSYSHYKKNNWESMLRHKFRLKIDETEITSCLKEIFDHNNALAKKFFRIERKKLVERMREYNYPFPLSLNNIIFFYNTVEIRDVKITAITPQIFIDEFGS